MHGSLLTQRQHLIMRRASLAISGRVPRSYMSTDIVDYTAKFGPRVQCICGAPVMLKNSAGFGSLMVANLLPL
jgi:hypothetical protein